MSPLKSTFISTGPKIDKLDDNIFYLANVRPKHFAIITVMNERIENFAEALTVLTTLVRYLTSLSGGQYTTLVSKATATLKNKFIIRSSF